MIIKPVDHPRHDDDAGAGRRAPYTVREHPYRHVVLEEMYEVRIMYTPAGQSTRSSAKETIGSTTP